MMVNDLSKLPVEEKFPYIKEKMVFDLVNGLAATKELNDVSKKESGLLIRFRNGLSGKDKARQNNINDHMLTGLEAITELTKELCKDVERNAVALIKINEAVQRTQKNIAYIAKDLVEFYDEFDLFARQVNRDLVDLRDEVGEIKRVQRAEAQLRQLMLKWKMGQYAELAPISRCYAVLDALYWGAFGEKIRFNNSDVKGFMDELQDSMILRLKEDLGINPRDNLPLDSWLEMPESGHKQDLLEALQFQGDWCLQKPNDFATVFTATQHWTSANDPQREPVRLLRRIDAKRIAKRMTMEMFDAERVA